MVCRKCGEVDKIIIEKKQQHIGCYCSKCGKWIKWVTKEKYEELRRLDKILKVID